MVDVIPAGLVRHKRLAERRYGPLPFWAEVGIAEASAEMPRANLDLTE